MNQEQEPDWEGYYKAIEGRPPRPVFLDGLALFEKSTALQPFAIDVGCGDGTETFHLLQNGWRVLAIDQQPAAVARVQSLVPPQLQRHLETRVAPFENLTLPPADFVYAGFSLPFCHPAKFDSLWAEMTAAIRPGGRFAGQLFGIHDTWADDKGMTFHTREQVDALLTAFDVEFFNEVDEDGSAVSGPKHWHVFHVLARKK